MDNEIEIARRYRDYAAQLRTMAANDPEVRTADILTKIAHEYDLIAENFEAIELLNQKHALRYPPHRLDGQ